jgi:hypothetical protein
VVRRGTATLFAALALGACSLGDDAEPRAPGAGTKDIVAAIEELERATRAGDFAAICNDLFSQDARGRSGGEDCEGALAANAEGIERASLTVRAIEIDEDGAEVRVRTRAAGQAAVVETIVFVSEDGEYRIDALGG